MHLHDELEEQTRWPPRICKFQGVQLLRLLVSGPSVICVWVPVYFSGIGHIVQLGLGGAVLSSPRSLRSLYFSFIELPGQPSETMFCWRI